MKFLSYLFSVLFALVFYLILILFHGLQWICLKFGYQAHKVSVDWLNWFLVKALLVLGNTVSFKKHHSIPHGQTIIFVSNHQSMFDIPPIIWHMRKHHPKFVSKIELGKGIPSVSFNLRHGGAALINRKDPKQAFTELDKFGKRIHDNNWSAVIFPEGTRSRNGAPKKFSLNGLKMIIQNNPEAYVVPIAINKSWKIFKYGKFPLGMFNKITLESFEPIHLKDTNVDQVLAKTEQVIKEHIKA
jgi:1-acyl-sn-glycerol-3-phosphate acyltransferase